MTPTLGKRLGCISVAVGSVRVIADIGTDHGLLPIAMLLDGQAEAAVACDIRPGPLDSARRNAERYGVSDRMEFLLTDGFHGVERFAPDAVVISGMGGELIARIISEAPYLRGDVRLFLQPMTRAESLRAYLSESGFAVAAEHIAQEGERLYSVIEARYTGDGDSYSGAQLLVGKPELHSDPLLLAQLALRTAERLDRKKHGLLASLHADACVRVSAECSELDGITDELRELIGGLEHPNNLDSAGAEYECL